MFPSNQGGHLNLYFINIYHVISRDVNLYLKIVYHVVSSAHCVLYFLAMILLLTMLCNGICSLFLFPFHFLSWSFLIADEMVLASIESCIRHSRGHVDQSKPVG